MKAQVGDRIILAGTRVDDPVRDGEVLEVKGSNGNAPYTVRWSDGHIGLVYPGPGAVMRVERGSSLPGGTETGAQTVVASKSWRVQVSVVETGDNTHATAMLISDSPGEFTGEGDSHRSPEDEPGGRSVTRWPWRGLFGTSPTRFWHGQSRTSRRSRERTPTCARCSPESL